MEVGEGCVVVDDRGLTDNYPHYPLTTARPQDNCSSPARDVTSNQPAGRRQGWTPPG